MAVYSFICTNDSCSVVFEHKCSINDYTGEATCPECGENTSQRCYDEDLPHFSVRLNESEITKVGHLAKRRGERMSADEIHFRENQNRTKKEEFLPDEHFKVHRKSEE